MAKKRGINRQQMFFLKCYADPLSGTWHHGTKSAIKAGYSEDSADVQASRILSKDKIQPILDELEDKYYIKSRATSAEQVTLNYIHDRDLARAAGQFQAAINATSKLGEIGGHFKQRQEIKITAGVESRPNIEDMTDMERENYEKEQLATDAANKTYKELMAGAGTGIERGNARDNPVKFIPSTDVSTAPKETNDNSEPEAVPAYEPEERVPAHLVGRSPGNPNHSANSWK